LSVPRVLDSDEVLRIREAAVQIIVEVEVEAGVYASEQHQSRINAPSECPNCGVGQSLEAHGYYWRWVSEALCGKVVRMAVRRFFVDAAQ
jgi:ribosomal protein S27AE